jgi:hypothetical protein
LTSLRSCLFIRTSSHLSATASYLARHPAHAHTIIFPDAARYSPRCIVLVGRRQQHGCIRTPSLQPRVCRELARSETWAAIKAASKPES